MPNRLADSTSPYLLQHQHNPVDWYEWGDEPFAIAERDQRPILLSVGYSACHWCHVMAHESFEDDATAAYMNEHFVNIKVDREERPDVDRIYMDALQAMSGQGGWPMTVFLTPNGQPFYAGTYFPKESRGHLPSFRQILEAVLVAWQQRRDDVVEQAGNLTAAIEAGIPAGVPPETGAAVAVAVETLTKSFDPEWGGFGHAPKFPQGPVLGFLLQVATLEPERFPDVAGMLRRTLDAMRAGGIYDQIGGGFARYSVDGQWLIPHFEKMLYDNALLARVYMHAGSVFSEPRYATTARETLDYLMTVMRDPAGGIHAAEDADSEGVEGKYYVWSYDEFVSTTGIDADLVGELYGVTTQGNFEQANNLHLAASPEQVAERHGVSTELVAAAKLRADRALRAARSRRIAPGRDDKVIAAWNGLALRAFAEAGAIFDEPRYLDTAVGIAEFVTEHMIGADGRLMRSWRQGRTSGKGFCIDYAAVAVGLFTLYQATGEARWYRHGQALTEAMLDLFAGPTGFFTTGTDASALIARPTDFMDNPLPSANSLAVEALTMLEGYTGVEESAIATVGAGAARLLERAPHAVAHLLSVLYTRDLGRRELAIVGAPAARRPLERVFWQTYRPDFVLATGSGDTEDIPLLGGRHDHGGAAAYVCRNFACNLPATSVAELARQLDD